MPIVNEATLIKQAAAVLTGDAQKLVAKSPASIMTGPIPDLVQEFVSAAETTLHFVIACAVLLLTDQPPLAKRGQSPG
jgi:hypothetical protein